MTFKILFSSPGIWLLIFLALTGCRSRSAGYSFTLKLSGKPVADSVQLVRYEGTKTFVVQTRKINPSGTHISGSRPLSSGMYGLKMADKIKVDFLLSDTLNQDFGISADAADLQNSLKFENSPENNAFTDYHQFLRNSAMKQARLQAGMRRNNDSPDSVNRINQALNQIKNEIRAKNEALVRQFPGSALALFVNTIRDPEIPEPVVPVMVTNKDLFIQEYYLRYMKDHFFDHFDFSDRRIITFPVYEDKLRFYFRQMVEPSPQVLEPAIETILGKAASNPGVYSFTTRFLYGMFRESPNPQFMEASAYIAENFILNDPEQWKDDLFVSNVREKVKKAKLNPVGAVSTDLKLTDVSGRLIRLSDIRARQTILYFFNPECEACIPITEKLHALYQKVKSRGIEVFAVYLDRKTEIWKRYLIAKKLEWINVYDPSGEQEIEKKYDIYAIPMIYLLDRDKKVTAKDVTVENLESLLQHVQP